MFGDFRVHEQQEERSFLGKKHFECKSLDGLYFSRKNLQQMIKQDGRIHHPAAADRPCPVLQYADDTLILLRADSDDLASLKEVLDRFSVFSGLRVNYNKSTLVLMHVPSSTADQLQDILGCQLGTFPQTYLGLPLSSDKLKLSTFAPLIAKSDKYLSGWQASLLNHMGRTVLVNTVMDSHLVHAMSVMLLQQGTLDAVDKRRRSFLWSGEDKASGAQCLVAWDKACLPRSQGGLGIKDLATQNKCLLLKLLHRLHTPNDSAWARWIRGKINLLTMHGDVMGAHWQELQTLLPLYRAVTACEVHNGESTNFWQDRWLSCGRLSQVFPLLYTHTTNEEVSVATVIQEGVEEHLVPRLTRAAREEFDKLKAILQLTQLS
ncbi:unnamed protein product, partial [Urochloa humidicola]